MLSTCETVSWRAPPMQHRSSAQCSVVTETGGMAGRVEGRVRRERIYVHLKLIHFVVQYCEATIPQLKKKSWK